MALAKVSTCKREVVKSAVGVRMARVGVPSPPQGRHFRVDSPDIARPVNLRGTSADLD